MCSASVWLAGIRCDLLQNAGSVTRSDFPLCSQDGRKIRRIKRCALPRLNLTGAVTLQGSANQGATKSQSGNYRRAK
jgi:hypothetical protein